MNHIGRAGTQVQLFWLRRSVALPVYQIPVYQIPVYQIPVYQIPVYQIPVYQIAVSSTGRFPQEGEEVACLEIFRLTGL